MLTGEKVSLIVDLESDLSQANDVDLLLDRVLREARRLTNAEAGSIYLRKGSRLEFSYTQNDVLQARLEPGKKLIYSTFTLPVDEKSIAGYAAKSGRLLNLTDVRRLPPEAPYAFSSGFDQTSGYQTRSMLTVPLMTREEVVGVLQLINARDRDGRVEPFSAADEPFIRGFAGSAAIALERAKMTRSMIMRIVEMARMRDPLETGTHVKRVAGYSLLIYERWARQKGLAAEETEKNLDVLKIAAMLHDVGKVAIGDAILKKPGKLDPEERAQMERHTTLGAALFTEDFSPYDRAAAAVALNHHERWDGGGYPGRRKGEEIPPFGRAAAIADVYDALTSRRCYKDPWTEDRVLQAMRDGAGTQFDPGMIEAFFFDLDAIRAVRARHRDAEMPS